MLKEQWINYLNENNAVYEEEKVNDTSFIYVMSKKEYKLSKKRAYKHIYVPYLRLSHFENGKQYVRDNGYCETLTDEVVKTILKKYF